MASSAKVQRLHNRWSNRRDTISVKMILCKWAFCNPRKRFSAEQILMRYAASDSDGMCKLPERSESNIDCISFVKQSTRSVWSGCEEIGGNVD